MNIIGAIVIFLAFAAGIQIFVLSFFLFRHQKRKYGIVAFFFGLILILIPVFVVLAHLQTEKHDDKSAMQTTEKLDANGVFKTGAGAPSPR